MTVYCMEMRSTQNWDDVRYRAYTTSKARADRFRTVPKINFTDSGHGIVPTVREHSGKRNPNIWLLQEHVAPYLNLPDRSGPTWRQLKEQRDDLLVALKNTLSLLKLFTRETDDVAKAAWDQAEAAISKADGD